MTDKAVPVHLRVPAETKARWVRDSREVGQKLTNWIVEKVDGPARPALDVRDEKPDIKRWYAIPYDDGFGIKIDLQEREPDWTDDYHIVITEDWYPGSIEDWKRDIADKVLERLEGGKS